MTPGDRWIEGSMRIKVGTWEFEMRGDVVMSIAATVAIVAVIVLKY